MSQMNSSVLLVGSIPGRNAHEVMSSCAEGLGSLLGSLPDGETGYRKGWINFLAAKTYALSEQIESVHRPLPVDPNAPDEWRTPDMDWIPRGFQDHWQFKVKEPSRPLRFETLGYAGDAKQSYQTFCALRDQGVIPQGVRFQVSLPLTESGTRLFLGLVHHTDGVQGTLQRLETAQKYVSGFGIATECGFGRRPPETIPELMRIHREAAARL